MCGHEESYDSIKTILRDAGKFCKSYYSFTTDKGYTDLLGKTASGLLKDAAARTAELTPDQRKKHEIALETFAAFCMYFCAKKIAEMKNVDHTLAGDVVHTVYGNMLQRIRKDLEDGRGCQYVRNLIKGSARNAALNLTEQENNQTVELLPKDDDDEKNKRRKSIAEYLLDGTVNSVKQQRRMTLIEKLLCDSVKKEILTEFEHKVICYSFGIGDGFEKMKKREIAQMLEISQASVTRIYQSALKKLSQYIEEHCERFEILYR